MNIILYAILLLNDNQKVVYNIVIATEIDTNYNKRCFFINS